MMKLALLIYVLAGPTLAGALMTVALAARLPNSTMLLLVAAGFVVAIPIAWYVAKVINDLTSKTKA